MAVIKIGFFNESQSLTDDQIKAVMPALQKQVSEHFAPVWGIDADLVFIDGGGSKLPAGMWGIGFFENTDQAGDLGYHDLTDAGAPQGKVFAGTDIAGGDSWTVTASHETLEMLADPDINLYALWQNGWELIFYAYEVCDSCNSDADGYDIPIAGGMVKVSDFVYPAWFENWRAANITQFDYCQKIQAPFQILSGSYISIYEASYGNGWVQQYPPGDAIRYSSRPQPGSRRERRRLPRGQWLRSAPRAAASRAR